MMVEPRPQQGRSWPSRRLQHGIRSVAPESHTASAPCDETGARDRPVHAASQPGSFSEPRRTCPPAGSEAIRTSSRRTRWTPALSGMMLDDDARITSAPQPGWSLRGSAASRPKSSTP